MMRTMSKPRSSPRWVAIAVTFLVLPALAADGSPNEVITSAIDELAAALDGRQEELAEDPRALREVIDPILLPRFDRKYAAQLVLGKHWRAADAAQRERFVEAFYEAMLRKYSETTRWRRTRPWRQG
jgi:phospholipid transport system substrate-binding protein